MYNETWVSSLPLAEAKHAGVACSQEANRMLAFIARRLTSKYLAVPEYGSEDISILPGGLALISSGLRCPMMPNFADDQRGQILLVDLNQPVLKAVALRISRGFDVESFNPHGLSTYIDEGKCQENYCYLGELQAREQLLINKAVEVTGLPGRKGLSYKKKLNWLGLFYLESRRIRGDLIAVYKITRGMYMVNFPKVGESKTKGHMFK
eukprot:g40278.t1